MKKNLLSVFLASALILSMTACSSTEPPKSTTDESAEATTAATEDELSSVPAESVATTTAATTTAATTTAATTVETEQTTSKTPEEKPSRPLDFTVEYGMNGQYCICTDDHDYYIYDTTEDRILNSKALMRSGNEVVGSVGNIVLYTETSDFNSEYFRKVTRIDNGQIIVTSGAGYTILTPCFSTGHVWSDELLMPSSLPVAMVEESFTGTVFKLGLLGTDGEWLYEVSDTYSICDGSMISADVLVNSGTAFYGFGDSVLISVSTNEGYGNYVYSFRTDSLTTLCQKGLFDLISLTDDYLIAKYDNQIVRYDEATGAITSLYTQQGHQLTASATDSYVKISDGGESFMHIFDTKTSTKLDYDLSEYDVNYIIGGNENFIAFDANNPSGEAYIILMDKNGEMIMDPIKGSLYIEAEAYERENCYVIGCKGKTLIIDKETFNIKEVNIEKYDNRSSIALLTSGKFYNVDKQSIHSIYK